MYLDTLYLTHTYTYSDIQTHTHTQNTHVYMPIFPPLTVSNTAYSLPAWGWFHHCWKSPSLASWSQHLSLLIDPTGSSLALLGCFLHWPHAMILQYSPYRMPLSSSSSSRLLPEASLPPDNDGKCQSPSAMGLHPEALSKQHCSLSSFRLPVHPAVSILSESALCYLHCLLHLDPQQVLYKHT